MKKFYALFTLLLIVEAGLAIVITRTYERRMQAFGTMKLLCPQVPDGPAKALCKAVGARGVPIQPWARGFVLIDSAGQAVAQGPQAIISLFQSHDEAQKNLRKAIMAPLILIGAGIVLMMVPVAYSLLVAVTPLLLCLSSLALGAPCLTCSVGGDTFSEFFPVGIFVLAGLSALLLWRPHKWSRTQVLALWAIANIVLLAQVGLMLNNPKFCPWCTLVGICALACSLFAGRAIEQNFVRVLSVPRFLYLGAGGLIALTALLQIATMTGHYHPLTVPESQVLTIAVNQPLRKLLKGYNYDIKFPAIVMVAMPGCHACDLARAALTNADVAYKEVEPCSMFRKTECFDPGNQSLATPTFLAVDSQEVVRRTVVGWAGPSTLSTLNDLALAMKENQ